MTQQCDELVTQLTYCTSKVEKYRAITPKGQIHSQPCIQRIDMLGFYKSATGKMSLRSKLLLLKVFHASWTKVAKIVLPYTIWIKLLIVTAQRASHKMDYIKSPKGLRICSVGVATCRWDGNTSGVARNLHLLLSSDVHRHHASMPSVQLGRGGVRQLPSHCASSVQRRYWFQ